MILTARTTRGREKTAIDSLKTKIDNSDMDIKAVFHPESLRGYIFVEGAEADIKDLANEVRNINGVIDEKVGIEKVEDYLSDEREEIKIETGDEVEVVGGAFKGEEAKITRVDETNREVTIELLDAAVPIPTTVDADMVRKRASQE